MITYLPFRFVKTYSIAAGSSITDTISPDFEISQVNITADADVTATVVFAGKVYTSSFNVVSEYGRPCKDSLTVNASNAGAAAESLVIEILGSKQQAR